MEVGGGSRGGPIGAGTSDGGALPAPLKPG